VLSIQPDAETFEISGHPEIGGRLRFGATYQSGSRAIFYAALEPGFRSLRPGVFFLDGASNVRAAAGKLNALGNL